MKNVRFSQMSPEDRARYNSKLLGIINKIMAICEENNIHWFVSYGACIGAVRHKGCIPWDDDIDICMPRPDYDRFVKICKESDLGEYELAIINETPGYYEHFVRLYDKNSTLYFSTDFVHVGGIFIDIFPLDGAADGNVEANLKRFRLWQVISHYSRFHFSKNYRRQILKKGPIITYLLIIFTSLFRKPLQKLSLKQIEKTIRKYPYENSEYCMYYVDVYGMRNVIQKKWVEETIFVPFENIQVRIPKYYDKYLTHIYGDYMTPPPDDKKDDRHAMAYLDFDRRLSREEILKILSE